MVPFPGQKVRQFGGTPEQLRHDIDAGRTRDKVRGSDPAAAPLGTDEEAAGTPVAPAAVATARRQERGQGAFPAVAASVEQRRRRRWTAAAFAALAALAFLSVWMAPWG